MIGWTIPSEKVQCVESIRSPATALNPFLDIVFIAFQFWVLGMSIVAVSFPPPLNFHHTLSLAVSRSSMNLSPTSLQPYSHTWLPPVS
jgi:hypothetical protein